MYVKGKILRKREKSWSGKNIMEQELLRKEGSLQQAISCLNTIILILHTRLCVYGKIEIQNKEFRKAKNKQ